MESAIPKHLQCPRLHPRKVTDDYTPPYPATVARYPQDVKQLVMAYFGVQYPAGAPAPAAATRALQGVASAFGGDKGPGHWDRAQYQDAAGFTNVITIGYWRDATVYADWFSQFGSSWASDAWSDGHIGTFTEVLRPAVDRFETLFSAEVLEGVAAVSSGLSGEIQEHAYWGGLRDRIPRAQTHDLAPQGMPKVMVQGLHQRVIPSENMCLIRSGQDWTETDAGERRMYLDDVEPVLRAGMDFLRDEGLPIGCFANRYMTVIDANGHPVEKSFGMSWWRSLGELEQWAESHPTHVAIFGAAMKYLGTLGPAAKLKLYHEVTVAAADEQHFEYYNCHAQTGMLRCAALSPQ